MMAAELNLRVVWYPQVAIENLAENRLEVVVQTRSPCPTRESAIAVAEKMAAKFGDSVIWFSARREEQSV